jgi:hypothetical protein
VEWNTFVEADLHKGGKCLHTITKLCEVPPVGEVLIDGVVRSDEEAMLKD